jgi:aerobic C4-dicarboxylate transport protein
VAGLALLLGIDRFMSEARAITNLIGNGVATMVVAKWEGALDEARARAALAGETVAFVKEPEAAVGADAEFPLQTSLAADTEQ